MSASREKKQRQGSTPAEKNMTAQEKAAAAKRKTIQYTAIGAVCAILVAALLIWDAGFIQRGATAATVGSTNYSAAEVTYYYNSIYQSTAMMAQYGFNSYDTSAAPEDQIYSTDAETGETTTYDDYFRQSALDSLISITARYEAAVADGYTAADVKDTVDADVASMESSAQSNGYSSFKQFLFAVYGKLVTPSVYREIVTREAIAELYVSDYTASLEYSDEELQTYYEENADTLDTFEYGYLYFVPAEVATTDADGNELSEEDVTAAETQAMEDAKALADEAAARLTEGESVEDIAADLSPSSSAAEASTLGSSLNSTYSSWLTDASREAGDVDVVEYTDNGYYVVAFHGRYLDETASANVRHILVRAELTADDPDTEEDESSTTPTDEQMAAAKAKAEEILAQWQAGEATEDSFAALAEENSEDGRDEDGNLNAAGGLYEGVYPGDFVTGFNDWLFNEGTRSAGDTGIVENNGVSSYYGYHVIYYVGSNDGEFLWKRTAQQAMANTATTEWTEGLEEGLTVTEASGMKYVG